MEVIIVSPEKTLFKGVATGVVVPGKFGSFEILKDHAPIISTLSEGVVKVFGDNAAEFKISSGFVEVSHNEISVCVEL